MSSRWRVLLTDRAWPDYTIESGILKQVDAEIVEAPSTDEVTLAKLARDVDAIGTTWAQVTAKVIEASPRCQVVSRFGIGLDNIAVDEATRRGIPVTNVPDYCLIEVAEHTWGLILACARNICRFHLRTKNGEYSLANGTPMRRLAGKTLGLIGLGRIGAEVARRANAFGMNVLACTKSGKTSVNGVTMTTLPELLTRSDYVSLHLPLTANTRGLLKLAEFRSMKRTAYVINTSRGPLIDSEDLWTALQENCISGAGLDVFSPEPPDLSLPLYRDERVILTPHAAFASEESLLELRTRAAHQIAAVLSGCRPENVVNAIDKWSS